MTFERDPEKLYPHDRLLAKTLLPFIPMSITPNMVTCLRMMLTPVVLLFLYWRRYDIGVPLFVFVAFTDALDGTMARVRKQITDWGTFYDPIADKLLIGSVVLLVVTRHINPLFGLLIVAIELMLVAGGYWRRRCGQSVRANMVGKAKMFLQFLGVTLLLVEVWSGAQLFLDVSIATLSLAIVVAIISLFTYGL